jgi:hypothetical protein
MRWRPGQARFGWGDYLAHNFTPFQLILEAFFAFVSRLKTLFNDITHFVYYVELAYIPYSQYK